MLSRTDGRAGGGEAHSRVLLRDSGGQRPASVCHTRAQRTAAASDTCDDCIIIRACAEVFQQRGDGDGMAPPKPIS